jgi:hypothetical protein
MIRDAGISHRAQVNRVEAAELIEPILRHHPASFEIVLATPIEVVPVKSYVIPASGGFENTQTFGHDFMPNAVPLNDCDLVTTHHASLLYVKTVLE